MRHLSGERLFNELHRLHPTGWSSWECLNADEQREVAQALSVVMEDREQVSWQRIKEENQRAIDAEQRVRHLEAECDRMREGWASANEGVNERLDQAFLDGYGAAYTRERCRFVPMAEWEAESKEALAEWHKADEPSEDGEDGP